MRKKNEKKKKVHSIRIQLAVLYFSVFLGVVLLQILANNLFLEKFYLREKQDELFSAYQSIKTAIDNPDYDFESFSEELNYVCNTTNIAIYVMDPTSNVKYESTNGGKRLEMRLFGYLLNMVPEVTVVKELEQCKIVKTADRLGDFLEMYGELQEGMSFIMSTPLESIRESAKAANRFFIYIGLLGTLLGVILVWISSRRLTRPILKLNDISKKMVEMDFEAKYQEQAHNELDYLGENMNMLSTTLEKTLSELKSANNELKKDIEKKEKIDEMRKEFLSNVSHELKTPIALIQGYAEGLQEGISEDPESREYYCEVIMDEAKKMNSMVQKLLNLNHIEFGDQKIEMVRFDLADMIRNEIRSSEVLTKQKEIEVRFDFVGSAFVWADEGMIEEVFLNYFSNAMNHCSGSRYIEICIKQMEDKVRVTVFNTGEAIPEESLPQIWDKFYKVDKARTREYGGSGVGLSIVKAIMDSLNQNYGVENYSNGVMFWFEVEAK